MSNNVSSGVSGGRVWLAVSGLALIAMGIIFLFQNFTAVRLGNWWAIFLLVPTVGLWARAWFMYQANGKRLSRRLLWPIVGGLMSLLVALVFWFNLDWGKIWPVMLIIAGLIVVGINLTPVEK